MDLDTWIKPWTIYSEQVFFYALHRLSKKYRLSASMFKRALHPLIRLGAWP